MALDLTLDQLLSFFSLSPDLLAVLGEDGHFLETNPAWEKTLGFKPNELQQTSFLELVHGPDQSKTQLEIHKLLKGEKILSFESQLRHKDQSIRWIQWTWHHLKDEQCFYLNGKDVTRLKETEKSLQENQAKFTRLTESATEGMAIHEKGLILEGNQALAQIFGFDRVEEMIGKNGLDLTAPEYKQLILNNILSGYEKPYEVVGVRKDGSRFDCLISGKPILYQGRQVRVSTFLDITLLKKREQELFESQELFRKLAEASKDGIVVSENGKILIVNTSLAKMFGYEVAEMVGRNAVEFAPPQFQETVLKKITDQDERPYEMMGLRKDGTRFPLEITPRRTSYQGRGVRVAFFRDITHRKKIEEEVQRQKDFSQNLINSTLEGLLAFDMELRYTVWNPAMERINGHSREEVLGQCAFEFFPFLEQIGEDRYYREALQGKTGFSQGKACRNAAGEQKILDARYMPIRNVRGEIIGGLGIIHDVTERNNTAEALRLSEMNLKAVFNNTFQNIILMDREGRIQTFNSNAAVVFRENTGKDLKVGNIIFDYTHPENVEALRVNLNKALQGEAAQLEKVYRMGDGLNHWFEINYYPVFDENGEIEGLCLTSLDIDDRKKVEEALQRSEADLRSVFNSGPQAIILASPDGTIRDFNPNAKKSVRDTRGQELETGRNLMDYVEPEFKKTYQERFQKALQGEVVRIERTVRGVDQQDHWFEFIYHPVFDKQGKGLGVCLAISFIDERKRAEEALRQSENNLKAIFNSVTQSVVLLGLDGTIQAFNRKASSDFELAIGRGLDIGKLFESYIRQEDSPGFRERFKEAQKGQRVHLERLYRMEDGSEHWFEYSYNPVSDDRGQMVGVCFVSSLIDERKKSQNAIVESEEKFRKVFENAQMGMTLVDKNFHFAHVNRAFCDFLGYSPKELIGRTFEEITYPEDLTQNVANAEGLKFSKGFRMQKRYLHKNESVLWANLSVTAFLDAKGELLYSLGMVEDITQRKLAEEALRNSEEKFRRIFEDAPTAMAMVSDYRFIKVNKAFRELLGYSEEEITGKTLFDITHPDDLPKTKTIATAVHDGKKDNFKSEKRYLRKGGQSLWANVSGTVIRDGAGNKLYSLIMIENISDRKVAQEALRKSEADLRAVFDSRSEVAILINRDGRIKGFNKSADSMAPRILGRGIETGMLFAETLPPGASLKIFQESFAAALEGKETKGERSIVAADGKERWVEVNYQPVFNDEGGVEGVCFSLTFIDRRKKAEQDLLESQERFERLAQVTQEGVLLHENPNVLDANQALADMLGYTTDEMVGKSGFDFLAPESHETARRNMREGSSAPYEALALRKDGTTLQVELQGRNFQYKGKELRVLSARDLTWRKQAERILTESEDRYRRLVEVSPEAIIVHAGGKVLYVNPTGVEMFGAEGKNVEGRSVQEVLHPESREMAMARVQQIMETGKPTDWIEQKLLRLNGEEFLAETKGIPFLYQGIPGVLTIARDITERKKSQQTLLRYERLAAVGKVIAGLAHEIRNPLAVVSGMSQILKAKLESRSEFSQELATILSQTDRLKLYMNDILDYSREMEIKKGKVDVQNLLEKSLVVVQAQIGHPHVNIQVKRQWAKNLPELWADGERLEQVLVNLILNAYQSMNEKGTLTLSCDQEGEAIFLGVRDDGPGISETDLPRLFEPFFTTKKHGSGLGLSISKKIVEAHGGKIEVQRIQPQGTLFTIQLPIQKT